MPARAGAVVACALAAGMCGALLGGTSEAASSSVVVTATVPSATSIDAAGCATGTPDVTKLGVVLPGSTATTAVDCVVQFGSSNDSSMLQMAQTDAMDRAMYAQTTGTLDSAFDGSGFITHPISPGTGADTMQQLVVQPDGKLVAADLCSGSGTGTDLCVTRYTTAGALDPTWNGSGKVTTAVAAGAGSDAPHTVALQSDGKVLVGGSCNIGGATGFDMCIARYTSTGALDPTWNGSGKVTQSVAAGANTDIVAQLIVQPDGTVLAAGTCRSSVTKDDFCLVRFTSTGLLDTTWGSGSGFVTAGGANTDTANGAVLQSDGHVVLAGQCDSGGASGIDVCLMRFTKDGALDLPWGSNGEVTTTIASGGGEDEGQRISQQPDGKLLVSGGCDMGGATGYDFCIERYLPDGTLDLSWNGNGKVTLPISPGTGYDHAQAVGVTDAGQVIAAGYCMMGGVTDVDYCAARFTADGTLDTTLGGTGFVTQSFATHPGSNDYGYAMAVESDGRFAVGGNCLSASGGYDICLEQYGNVGEIAQYTPGVTDWTTTATSAFGACLHTLGGIAVATWTQNATCDATDGAWWNSVPTSPTTVATAATPTTVATVGLRFGMRAAPDQPPGSYQAPVTFQVVAPAA